ncbi:ABC transporter ATP-binding protein [Staphylococcus americanisciuri]|uniref:ABC transporter ATP-binding protein n=1 Tax=Staphylococcus americanisciuri TaxID=2973940 RepID=A0ABT2F167_9STAP|nr:ABC transporter ATP-binding protein [Staphylococcus americanisciuri]MCS4486171.1 ABC transporter ATP-binding protein [Staphylococcus americanisciuri]
MIEIQNVTKVYGKKKVLEDVSFQLHESQCVALIGPNGAGKSTLIDIMIGNRHPNAGKINNQQELLDKQQIGILYQKTAFPELVKVKELFNLYRAFYKECMTLEEFKEVTGFDGQKLNQYASKLSGGEARILDFALSIIGKPQWVVLDEPTSAMDTETRQHFWQLITRMKRQGVTIFYTSHYIEEVERMADRVVVLNQGRLVADNTPQEIRYQETNTRIQLPLLGDDMVAQIQELDAVKSVNRQGDGYTVVTQDVQPVIQWLIQREVDLNQIEITKSSLLEALFSHNREGVDA